MKYKVGKSDKRCPFHNKVEWLIVNKPDENDITHSYCIECIFDLIKEVEKNVGEELPTVEEM